jgi:hypothetical protein
MDLGISDNLSASIAFPEIGLRKTGFTNSTVDFFPE